VSARAGLAALALLALLGTAGTVLARTAIDPAGSAASLALDVLATPPATTERISVGADGRQGNDASGGVSAVFEAMNPDQAISADGRWVAFASRATNLVPGETHPGGGLFLRDRQAGSTGSIPWIGGGPFPTSVTAAEPSISADGAVVAFTVVVSGTSTGAIFAPTTLPYVLAWDRATNLTEIVSVSDTGSPTPGYQPSVSADGRYVAYTQWFVDKTPPVLSNLTASATHIGGCSGPNSTTISVTATDADSTVSSVTLYYTPLGGSTLSQPMAPAGGNVWQYTIERDPFWSTGQITYRVQAVDSHGNVSALLFPNSANELFNEPCIL